MKSYDIVGYTYKAENVHPRCLKLDTAEGGAFDGWALASGVRMSVEANLNEVAAAFGIDRMNERTFNSDEFPKVIFADSIEDGECCSACGTPLIDSD